MDLAKRTGTIALMATLAASSSDVLAAPDSTIERCATDAQGVQRSRKQHQLLDARNQARRCATDECPSVIRDDCRGWLDELDRTIPTTSFRVVDDDGSDVVGATITLDEGRKVALGSAVELDPGPHSVTAEADHRAQRTSIVIAEGEQRRVIVVRLPRRTDPTTETVKARETRSWPWPWIAGGVSLAGFATFTALQIAASARVDDLARTCGRQGTGAGCPEGDVSGVRDLVGWSSVALGLGVAAGVAAVVLIVVAPRRDPTAATRGFTFDF